MPHPKELIEKIASLLENDYSKAAYNYIFERGLRENTSIRPDIQIIDKTNGQYVCIVEIGYTRPEKLTHYRNILKVNDVRWYDKQGILHPDVNIITERVTLELCPPKSFYQISIFNVGFCEDCYKDEACFHADHPCDVEHNKSGECEAEHPWNEEVLEEITSATLLTILTDGIRAIYHCYCDRCGDAQIQDRTWLGVDDTHAQLATDGLLDFLRNNGSPDIRTCHETPPLEGPPLTIDWNMAEFLGREYRDRFMELSNNLKFRRSV